jgi:hypothetical protein
VRDLVTARLTAWRGEGPGLSRAWADSAIEPLRQHSGHRGGSRCWPRSPPTRSTPKSLPRRAPAPDQPETGARSDRGLGQLRRRPPDRVAATYRTGHHNHLEALTWREPGFRAAGSGDCGKVRPVALHPSARLAVIADAAATAGRLIRPSSITSASIRQARHRQHFADGRSTSSCEQGSLRSRAWKP